MKKVLFVINNLEIGGIQKSLMELLKCICHSYEITLFCIDASGPLSTELPDNIKVVEGNKFAKIAEWDAQKLRKLGLLYSLLRVLFVGFTRLLGKKTPAFVYSKFIHVSNVEYDLAISYAQPLHSIQFANLCNEIVLYSIKAQRKATFVHCDYKNYGGDCDYNRWLYKKFNLIAAVSNSVKNRFVETIPSLKEKVCVVYNACDIEQIHRLSKINTVHYKKKAIVSVSRLSKEKGLARCIPIIYSLIKTGYEFEWHILGDGPERMKIRKLIEEYSLEGVIFLEGMQSNPYRFIKNADYLFLPSFHEAAPMVFNEAATLNTFVLTTKTLSAIELVEKRGIGMVCENTEGGIAKMLEKVLTKKYTIEKYDININNIVRNQFDTL